MRGSQAKPAFPTLDMATKIKWQGLPKNHLEEVMQIRPYIFLNFLIIGLFLSGQASAGIDPPDPSDPCVDAPLSRCTNGVSQPLILVDGTDGSLSKEGSCESRGSLAGALTDAKRHADEVCQSNHIKKSEYYYSQTSYFVGESNCVAYVSAFFYCAN